MKLLWLTWKDQKNPLAGGAEVVNQELAKRLAAEGHEVVMIVAGFPNAKPTEAIDGYKIIRLGNRVSVYYHAWRYYRKHLRGWPDLVIDEVNTIPFFASFYVQEPTILIFYMLCREIWFYQLPFPISLIGYVAEPIYLRLISNQRVITISSSTKLDLIRHGFKQDAIEIIPVGIELIPVTDLKKVEKYPHPTLLSLGAFRAMKRTHHQIQAFELAKKLIPDLQLKIAGDASGSYGRKILRMIETSKYKNDIEYLGRVTKEQKRKLMQKCHLIMVTSVKEGWGLIVTEAASQGTPAVVYDVDGLRDSVMNHIAGTVVKAGSSSLLALAMTEFIKSEDKYSKLRIEAWEESQKMTFSNCYTQFNKVLL